MSTILKFNTVQKWYNTTTNKVEVLKGISFSIEEGETISIVGSSGSGKTTLLGLAAGLDNVSSGSIDLLNTSLTNSSEEQRAALRAQHVGFIFQSFFLIDTLTALENVLVPMELLGLPNAKEKATELLNQVGLGARITHYPKELSGGEQQRVALARAFANNPKVLFADEPTGNLDDKNSAHVEELLFELNQRYNTTLILVTHDKTLAQKTQRSIVLKNGQIESIVVNS